MRNLLRMRIAHADPSGLGLPPGQCATLPATDGVTVSVAVCHHGPAGRCHLHSADDWGFYCRHPGLHIRPKIGHAYAGGTLRTYSGRWPAAIRRSMVRSETPSCSAASLLVISSRPGHSQRIERGPPGSQALARPDGF